jgi:hypothetical protein
MFLPNETAGRNAAMERRITRDRDHGAADPDRVRTVSSDVSPVTSEEDPGATSAGINTKLDLGVRGTADDEDDDPGE